MEQIEDLRHRARQDKETRGEGGEESSLLAATLKESILLHLTKGGKGKPSNERGEKSESGSVGKRRGQRLIRTSDIPKPETAWGE